MTNPETLWVNGYIQRVFGGIGLVYDQKRFGLGADILEAVVEKVGIESSPYVAQEVLMGIGDFERSLFGELSLQQMWILAMMFSGMGQVEIARELNISQSWVCKTKNYAVDRLRRDLGKRGVEIESIKPLTMKRYKEALGESRI